MYQTGVRRYKEKRDTTLIIPLFVEPAVARYKIVQKGLYGLPKSSANRNHSEIPTEIRLVHAFDSKHLLDKPSGAQLDDNSIFKLGGPHGQ